MSSVADEKAGFASEKAGSPLQNLFFLCDSLVSSLKMPKFVA